VWFLGRSLFVVGWFGLLRGGKFMKGLGGNELVACIFWLCSRELP
jgi:hypothetical protein